MSKYLERQKLLSPSGRIDLWEHACLLYRSFEWQSAADSFTILERNALDPRDRITFALNRGLIEARLGDFSAAARTWEHTLSLDDDDALSHFLLGLVHVELGDYTKGHGHLKASLDKLPGQGLDCSSNGLAFSLTPSAVRENVERLELKLSMDAVGLNETASFQLSLHSIPADLIFEAPSRTSSIFNLPSSPSEAEQTDSAGAREHQPGLHASRTQDESIVHSSSMEQSNAAPKTDRAVQDSTSTALPLHQKCAHATNEETSRFPVTLKPSNSLTSREPQVEQESTRELARFLRYAGPNDKKNITVDREYMLQLLQNNTAGVADPHTIDEAPGGLHATARPRSLADRRDGLESLLDMYNGTETVNTSIRKSSQPSNSIESSVSKEQGQPLKSVGSLDVGNAASSSDKKEFKRKPLPSSVPRIEGIPEQTEAPRPQDSSSVHSKDSKASRLAMKTAQRWLRKEVRPPWPRSLTGKKSNMSKTTGEQSPLSVGSSNKSEIDPSTRSTVSTLDFFNYGMKEKSMSMKQALWESGWS